MRQDLEVKKKPQKVVIDRQPTPVPDEVFKLTEVAASEAAKKGLGYEDSTSNYASLDISSFKDRYRMTRIKERMVENQVEDRVREQEHKLQAKYERKQQKLMQIILKQQTQLREMLDRVG
jgi:hypothetical protein